MLISPAEYPAAFQAAKDLLREYEFELDRVDAEAGIITTHPRASAGFATPWIPHMTSPEGALEGYLQPERRIASITFDGNADQSRALRANVQVLRLVRPGKRPSIASIRLTSAWTDPALVEQGVQPAYVASSHEDSKLGQSLARALRQRLAVASTPTDSAGQ